MQQYLQLLKDIKEKGTHKPAAREGMPGSTSLFGYQFRHNLQDGFPLLTTKKMYWKGIVIELIWFLRGDTNIKFLVDNGVNIWNEDAYNYYLKQVDIFNRQMISHFGEKKEGKPYQMSRVSYDRFLQVIRDNSMGAEDCPISWSGDNLPDYHLGECGYQYGKAWRKWYSHHIHTKIGATDHGTNEMLSEPVFIDQIKNLIEGLRSNPESRRHIVTAIDPVHANDLALYWCHVMFQMNCRPLSISERLRLLSDEQDRYLTCSAEVIPTVQYLDEANTPKYYLDCHLYQRSADAVLGVPFNIASYALLTHIIAEMCNMIPGEFIHTFGDVHIYDNHEEAVMEQLQRTPKQLPTLLMEVNMRQMMHDGCNIDQLLELIKMEGIDGMFGFKDYDPHPAIKAELSTGLKK